MRATGATFRLLLRCMDHASAKDNQLILIIFSNQREADRTHVQTYRMMMEAIPSFVTFDAPNRLIDLKNGSRIMFRDEYFVERPQCVGLKWTLVVEDHSMDATPRRPRYIAMLQELRSIVRRNVGL